MSNRDEILRGAVAASRLHDNGIDEAFIIDYLIEKLIFEQHRAAVLVKIHEDYLSETGRAAPVVSGTRHGLRLERINIPFLAEFDTLFDYRRDRGVEEIRGRMRGRRGRGAPEEL